MNTRCLDVLAMGEAMIEFNAIAGAPGHYLEGAGGDTSNCVVAAARLGARAGYLTQVGDDVFGAKLLDLWSAEGVDCQAVTTMAGATTGIYFVTHDADGHQFTYRRAGSAASLMTPAGLVAGSIARSRWLHCSGISQAISVTACDAVFEAIAIACAAGTEVSYDLNFRPALWPAARALAIARATLASCDLFFPSVDEVSLLTGISVPEDIVRWSHDQGARIVALKLGSRGCLLSTPEGAYWVPSLQVSAVDATGAGDCFAGALLARLSAGDAPHVAARAANVAAALSTTGFGAVSPLPSWRDVYARLGSDERIP